MNLRDTLQLQVWLRARVSLAEVEELAQLGILDNERFSDQAVRAFRLLWRWSARHMSDDAQWRFAERCGRCALERRIARCRERINVLTSQAITYDATR